MTRTKSIIGALALCAVSICAFAAASASASELTAVTCVDAGVEPNLNSHCATKTEGTFTTKALPLDTTTALKSQSTEAEPTLRGVVAGLNVTIKCSTSEQIGPWIKNHDNTGKHEVTSGATRDTYTGCHAVLKSKETRTCAVEEITGPNPGTIGMVSTNELEGETTGTAHQVKIKPVAAAEGVFAEFNILKKGSAPTEENECFFSEAGANVKVKVTGSVEGEANTENHSHLTFTELNNGEALEANGVKGAKYLDTVGGTMAGGETATVGAQTFT